MACHVFVILNNKNPREFLPHSFLSLEPLAPLSFVQTHLIKPVVESSLFLFKAPNITPHSVFEDMTRWMWVDQDWGKVRVKLRSPTNKPFLLDWVLTGDLWVVDCAVWIPGRPRVMIVSLLFDELFWNTERSLKCLYSRNNPNLTIH